MSNGKKSYIAWTRQLKKRLAEVGKLRDAIRADVSEMQALEENCERAYQDMERAIDALSELS